MKYVSYGRTGKRVSVVGFGGMRFDLKTSLEQCAEVMLHAADRGINYFDTAPDYCDDKSEEIFGIALRQMKPGTYFVSTKGMPEEFDTADKARDAVRRSLDRMGVPKIHFYHVWCLRRMEHYELAMRPGGQYEGLLRCKEEGLVDHIVCSSHQPGAEIRQLAESGRFDGILMGINILNFPYRRDGALAAREQGMGVVAMNPLAGGEIPKHEREFAFLASPGETPTEAALRFVIGCPQITIALVGFTTKAHVDTACAVADRSAPMSEDEIARVARHLGRNLNEVCTGCGYCSECPKNIPIPSYMQFFNEKVMFGREDAALNKSLDFHRDWGLLASRKADAADCIECARCEEACTQHLPIRERLKQIAQWEAALKAEQ